MTEKLISTSEAASILGVSASRVRQLIIEGRLESTKIGRDQLLEPDKVREFATRPRERTGRPKTDMS
jgi:excisionase family DNA binding protein